MTERPVDFEAVARDDQLLDLLGAGQPPTSTDATIRALYAWRTDITAGVDDAVTRPATPNGRRPVNGAQRAVGTARVNGTARANGVAPSIRTPVNGARRTNGAERPGTEPADVTELPRRRGRRRAAVAAAVVGLSAGLGGVAVAAADAEPGSPLWPITKVIYADTAEDRQAEAAAEAALAKARRALAAGRVDEAERYLDEAGRHAGSVDPDQAGELRNEMDAVRDEIDEKESTRDPDRVTSPTPGPSDGDKGGPLPTPTLPTPSSGAGGGGKDGASGDGSGKKGAKDDRNNDERKNNGSPESSSSELSLIPNPVSTKPLPEF